ncbi:MAG: YjbH domain-containing protein [Thiotrichaceae bacterium]|nr:YjbH domain-containing protein [Thiotrichaceae bacterium]
MTIFKLRIVLLVACIFPSLASANSLSYSGASGVILTPNAHLVEEASVSYQYNNYIERNIKNTYKAGANYIFSMGLSNYVELGGRLTDYPRISSSTNTNGPKGGRIDLSGNLKIKMPKLIQWMPSIALGVNDFAGEAVNFRSHYVVATQSLSSLDVSLGYIVGENSELQGKFASLDYDINPSFSLRAEYDTQGTQLGLRYDLSNLLHVPLSLQVSRSMSDTPSSFAGIGFTLPFDGKRKKASVLSKQSSKAINRQLEGSEQNRIKQLMDKLANYGFEHLKIGKMPLGQYILLVENRVFNHSRVDAVAIVLGTMQEFLPDSQSLKIIFTQQGQKEMFIETNVGVLAEYLKNGASDHSQQKFRSQLIVGFAHKYSDKNADIVWFSGLNHGYSSWFDIKLSPSVATSVGHEWGVFDYSLALQTDVKVNLWQGGNLLLSGHTPVHSSINFKEGRVFSRGAHQSGLKQALIQQYIRPTKQLFVLASLGKMTINRNDFNTAQTEARWMSPRGNHQFSTHLASFDPDDEKVDKRKLALGSYEYHLNDSDWSAELSVGEFFEGDQGTRLRLKRRFGDAVISLYGNYIKEDDMSAGISLSLPLTPRKDYKNKHLLVRGRPAWKYKLTTTVKDPVLPGSNRLRPNMMFEPRLASSLSNDYLDSNRATPSYMMANISRLREAYFTLRQ